MYLQTLNTYRCLRKYIKLLNFYTISHMPKYLFFIYFYIFYLFIYIFIYKVNKILIEEFAAVQCM